jgi:hypothetical protein
LYRAGKRSASACKPRRRRAAAKWSYRPCCEALEDRCLLSRPVIVNVFAIDHASRETELLNAPLIVNQLYYNGS